MKNKVSIVLALCISIALFNGCTKEKPIVTDKQPIVSSEETEPVKPAATVPEETSDEVSKFYSPFTGEEVDEDTFNNIPFFAIVENSKEARPQSGLKEADIVYETMAEGGIPRTIALFQKNSPEKIGPIRSARACFLGISREYNFPLAHCGASYEAEDMIKTGKFMSLNEFAYGGFYWREKDRKAPHNLYTSSEKIRSAVVSRKYNKTTKVKLNFDKDFWENESLPAANTIALNLSKYYNTDYNYKDGKYYKNMNGKPSFNKEDEAPLAITNIVIQATSIKKKQESILMDIALIGKGTGYVISNGKYIKMNWSKKDASSQTILKDENGKVIPLNPGNTWWNIVDTKSGIEIN